MIDLASSIILWKKLAVEVDFGQICLYKSVLSMDCKKQEKRCSDFRRQESGLGFVAHFEAAS